MKKIVSLVLTAVLVCTLLSVFVLPASAETAEDYMIAGEDLKNERRYEDAADTFLKAAKLYKDADDPDSAAMAYRYAGGAFFDVASQYQGARIFAPAADAYMKAGECYEKANDLSNAKTAFGHAAKAVQNKLDELDHSTGSILSGGSLVIIVGVACLVVGALGMYLIMKKKKPAVAGGENNEE